MRQIPIIAVLLGLFFAGSYLFLISCCWFNLKGVEISGDANLTLNEIAQLTPVVMGTNIFRLDAQKIENCIRKDWRISQVKMTRTLPNKIKIEIRRKRPVFLINLDQLYGLTKTKEIILLEGLNQGLDLPIISGVAVDRINFYREAKIPQLQKAIDFYHTVLAVDSSFLGEISELDLSHPENLILYLLPSGLRVLVGSGDYERRIARLIEVLRAESNIERLSCIDLRFQNQAVVRNRKPQVKEYES